jgi:hypothetical protein
MGEGTICLDYGVASSRLPYRGISFYHNWGSVLNLRCELTLPSGHYRNGGTLTFLKEA